MLNRFFKLIYVFALIAIAISLPICLFLEVDFSRIFDTDYKAKCLSNNKYVVLQGSALDEAYIFSKTTLNDSKFSDTKKDLNFYCKYYDKIQPHIIAYAKSKTTADQVKANIAFFTFKDSVLPVVSSSPKLYKLEVVDREFNYYAIVIPFILWLEGALLAFIILQILRISYLYIVFGKIIWHPLKHPKKK
ncbi:hypothetical protein KJ885_02360 [Patescibacteria group bacterium]|nr:hypothetical protein [Patescibacteria group bacterium]